MVARLIDRSPAAPASLEDGIRSRFQPASPRLAIALLCSVLLHGLAGLLPSTTPRNQSPHSPRLSAQLSNAAAPSPSQPPASRLRATKAHRPRDTTADAAPEAPAPPVPKGPPQRLIPFELPLAIFVPSEQLTVKPEPLAGIDQNPVADFPEVKSGKLTLTLWINDTGKVVDVRPESGTLPDALVKRIVTSFEQLPFKPGELAGRPVGTLMRIEITVE